MSKGKNEAKQTIQITGWKWSSLKNLESAEAKAIVDIDLPKGSDEKTVSCISASISYTDKGAIDFYFLGDNATSEMKGTLGRTETFDVSSEI
tara:strand:- start:312 stop:587 length:276 start_codon:yes stop_codon:yes gene_type:complete